MKNYNHFIYDLGQRESNNDYACKNAFGFLGRWQFGKPRLYDAGYSVDNWSPKGQPKKRLLSEKYFLDNTLGIQDKIMKWHVYNLADSISKNFSEYFGKEINGVVITLSGLIAGAHLKGIGGVKQFLRGHDNSDALGTKISEYIKKFADYELYPKIKDEVTKIDKLSTPRPPEIIS